MEWIVLLSVFIATLGQLHAYLNKEINENDLEEAMLAQWLRVEQESSTMDVADELLQDEKAIELQDEKAIELLDEKAIELQDEKAIEQTSPLCNIVGECDCQLKKSFTVKTKEPGATCFFLSVPYCEGPCKSVYRYMLMFNVVNTQIDMLHK